MTLGPLDQQAETEEIRKALYSFAKTVSEGNVTNASLMYADAPDFYWMEKGVLRYSSAADARASLNRLGESGMSVAVQYTDIQVTLLGPRSAIATATFESDFSHSSGPVFEFDGLQTTGLKKTKQGWRIVSGHTEAITD